MRKVVPRKLDTLILFLKKVKVLLVRQFKLLLSKSKPPLPTAV